MSSARDLKRRIKTAGNISKITKAMEAVAASKMKKAQDAATASIALVILLMFPAVFILRLRSLVFDILL